MPKTIIKAIELLKPHTHAGRDYKPGNVLNLELVGMDHESAAWLISLGTAREAAPQQPQPIIAAQSDRPSSL